MIHVLRSAIGITYLRGQGLRPHLLCLIAAVVLLCLPVVAEACPSCKQSLAASSNPHLVRGFGWSIIFMLSMPFLILASLGGYFFTLIRRADRIALAKETTGAISFAGQWKPPAGLLERN